MHPVSQVCMYNIPNPMISRTILCPLMVALWALLNQHSQWRGYGSPDNRVQGGAYSGKEKKTAHFYTIGSEGLANVDA